MSYINDALKKAQGERDSRYEGFNGIIAPGPDPQPRPRKRRVFLGIMAALAVFVPAALFLTVYAMHQSSPSGKGGAPAPALQVVSANPATTRAAGQPAPAVRPGAASVALEAGEAAAPQGGDKPSPEAEARYQEAFLEQRKGNPDKAEALYRKVLLLTPGHVKSLNNLGVLYMGQKKRDRAVSMFSRAIVLKKDYVDPYYNMACLHAQNKEIDESLWYLKVAMTIDNSVKKWAESDPDLKNVTQSPAFKKIMEGQKS